MFELQFVLEADPLYDSVKKTLIFTRFHAFPLRTLLKFLTIIDTESQRLVNRMYFTAEVQF